jgi:hypothetical protein
MQVPSETIHPQALSLLMEFQVEHTRTLLRSLQSNGVALDCSDAGTGKTYVLAAICLSLGLRPFVIGLKAGISNVYRVCELFGVSPLGNVNYETIKNGKFYHSLEDFHSETREHCEYVEVTRVHARDPMTKKLLYTPTGKPKMVIEKITWAFPTDTLIIFDEAHKGRNGKASGVETGNSKLMSSIRSCLSKSRRVYGLFLSATLTDKLDNFDVIAYLLGLYKPYQKKIYEQFLRRFGRDPETVFKGIHRKIFPAYGSRMDIKAIKAVSGDTVFKVNDLRAVAYPVDQATALEVERANIEIQAALADIRSRGLSIGWGRVIRLWQRIEVLKVPLVADLVADSLREGRSVVVFVNFTETKRLLVDKILALENTPISIEKIDFIDGDQNAAQRDAIQLAFQADELHLLICQIRAGGVSLSLHDVRGERPRSSFVFPTWSATDLKQSLGRIYRTNARSDAYQRIVYCKYVEAGLPESSDGEKKETLCVEVMLCRNVNAKLENIELLNNGDLSGVERIDIAEEAEEAEEAKEAE